MYANEISERIDSLDQLPYHCILFNGPWGIGKSYAADNIVNKANTVRVSLSGLKNSNELYTEILDALYGKNGVSEVSKKVLNTATKMISSVPKSTIANLGVSLVSDMTESVFTSKNRIRIYFNRKTALRTIILDDFERVWDGIDISEVFKVVEFLTSLPPVRVVILSDLSKLPKNINEKFKKYSERYIERIYYVSSIAKEIDWKELGIDSDFIKDFQKKHPVKNLRSIIKAHNLYQDLKYTIEKKSSTISYDESKPRSKAFLTALRLSCFSVVIEDIDHLYLPETSAEPHKIHRKLSSRARNYTQDNSLASQLIETIIDYYKNDHIDIESFEYTYAEANKESSPVYLLMSDANIKGKISELKRTVELSSDIMTLIKRSKELLIACTIAEYSEDVLETIKKTLHALTEEELKKQDHGYFPYDDSIELLDDPVLEVMNHEVFSHDASIELSKITDLKDAINREHTNYKKSIVNSIIDKLKNGCTTPHAAEFSKQLKEIVNDSDYQQIIRDRLNDLLTDNAFPINAHTNESLSASSYLLDLIKFIDQGRLIQYWDSMQQKDLESAAVHRCEYVLRGLGII